METFSGGAGLADNRADTGLLLSGLALTRYWADLPLLCMLHHETGVIERLELRKLSVHDHALVERGTRFTTSRHSCFNENDVTCGVKAQCFNLKIWP